MRSKLLDSKFWSRFAKTYWEQKPLVIKNIKSSLLELNEAEVFKLLVLAADQSRKDKTPLGFKFFVDGIRSSDVEVMHVLPKKSDRNLLRYNERMERVYQDYCLDCDELLQVNQDKQHLLTQFTRTLYTHVGFTNRFAEMGLYLGNYRTTPFGVHVDRCGVFSFPVIGVKNFRAWTSDYVSQHPDLEQSFQYSKHKKKSVLLEAKPGDMAYWPSSVWHIAESNGSFSATWSLGIWVDRTTREEVSDLIMNAVAAKLGSALDSPSVKVRDLNQNDGQVIHLPQIFEKAISAVNELSSKELRTSFTHAWLKKLSASGMKTPPRQTGGFKLGERLTLRHLDSPIFWTVKSNDNFLFSFVGSEPMSSKSERLLKLIKDLNLGQTCTVKNYLSTSTRTQDIKVLNFLGQLGAFGE